MDINEVVYNKTIRNNLKYYYFTHRQSILGKKTHLSYIVFSYNKLQNNNLFVTRAKCIII